MSARAGALALILIAVPTATAAQTPPTIRPSPSTATVDATTLQDLPIADDAFAALETIYGMVITDRFSSGGVSDAQPARVGGFMNSWTQTTFRIGDVNVTSPDGGVPLFEPPLVPWEWISATASDMPADTSAPGLLISLEPRRPESVWTGMADGSGLPPAFVSRSAGAVPSVARPHEAFQGRGVISGPLGHRLGVVLAADWNQSSQFDRGSSVARASRLSTLFGDLSYAPDARTGLHAIALIQRAAYPSTARVPFVQVDSSDHDTSAHLQLSWERRAAQGSTVRLFGAFTTQTRSAAPILPGAATVERLIDGPVSALTEGAGGTRRRWSVGARYDTARAWGGHAGDLNTGFDAGRAAEHVLPGYPSVIRELVDGLPAREWRYAAPREEGRAMTTVAGFVSDRLDVYRRLTIDTALRFDGVRGKAQDAMQGISWTTWLPRATLRWNALTRPGVAAFAGYGRSADALTFGALDYGDPAAPIANVYRWTGGADPGALVARTGPGTGGEPGFSAIDPRLARPTTGEIDLGVDVHPASWMRIRYAETLKRETHELAVLNTGATQSAYSVSAIPDPGASLSDPRDDQILSVYNRLPASFGTDRYLLTNSPVGGGTFGGMNLALETSTTHLWLFAGAKTNVAKDRAGNRGFHAGENDPGILGELFVDPNASTHSRGRPFSDRSYTVKISGVYRFAHDARLGVIARYQDGQPYSRLVIVSNLNQGPEAIRAVNAGISRFTYTGTLDVRLQKGFARGVRRIAVMMDVYNLPNMRKEVEEYVVTGPHFRDETVRQPPRTVFIGLRISR